MKYICENKQKRAQSIFCVLVCLYIKVKTDEKNIQKKTSWILLTWLLLVIFTTPVFLLCPEPFPFIPRHSFL